MTHKTFKFRGVEVCNCECHKSGKYIIEFLPCCNLQGFQYVNEDGTVKEKDLYNLLRMDFVSTLKRRYKRSMEEI